MQNLDLSVPLLTKRGAKMLTNVGRCFTFNGKKFSNKEQCFSVYWICECEQGRAVTRRHGDGSDANDDEVE